MNAAALAPVAAPLFPEIVIELPGFAGPLSALLLAAREHRIELAEIPLYPICETYLSYLAGSENADEAGGALAALAWLVERKAWSLLPPAPEPEPEPDRWEEPAAFDPPGTLPLTALESDFRERLARREELFFRPGDAGPSPYELPYELKDASAHDLAACLRRLLDRQARTEIRMAKPRRSMEDQIAVVRTALRNEWGSLESYLPEGSDRLDAVYWFLSLLELVRLGEAWARSEEGSVAFRRSDPTMPIVREANA